jgi:hypothetical protein
MMQSSEHAVSIADGSRGGQNLKPEDGQALEQMGSEFVRRRARES